MAIAITIQFAIAIANPTTHLEPRQKLQERSDGVFEFRDLAIARAINGAIPSMQYPLLQGHSSMSGYLATV